MNPWDGWIPGVLSNAQVHALCKQEYIKGVRKPQKAIGHSSIDLSLDDVAFEMIEGSVKPGHTDYNSLLQNRRLATKLSPSPDHTYLLRNKATYVFKLRERLSCLANHPIHGQAAAKSSVGRVDHLARLIVDGMDTYDEFDPKALANSSGDMYLEITPITFDVKVKPGIPLTQLRFFYGRPKDAEMRGDELYKTVLVEGPGAKDGSLAVHLENETWGELPVAAFCAKGTASHDDAIPLWVENERRSDPCKYWRFKESTENRLRIEKEQFYILRSKEKLAVPPGIAIYCRASDETIGEMRIHYAGFVHPLFGLRRKKGRGTPLIFEVRGHQVDVSLADGEKMAKLQFFRMSEDCNDEQTNPKSVKSQVKDTKTDLRREYVAPSPYEDQTLKLSDFFHKWPDKLRKVGDDGSVEAA